MKDFLFILPMLLFGLLLFGIVFAIDDCSHTIPEEKNIQIAVWKDGQVEKVLPATIYLRSFCDTYLVRCRKITTEHTIRISPNPDEILDGWNETPISKESITDKRLGYSLWEQKDIVKEGELIK